MRWLASEGHWWGDRTFPGQEDLGPGSEEPGKGWWGKLRGLHLRTSVSALGVGDCTLGWEWRRPSSAFSGAGERKTQGLRCVKWGSDEV